MDDRQLKATIEALLFVAEHPVEIERLAQVLEGVEVWRIKAALSALEDEYRVRGAGIQLVRVAEGYQLCTVPEAAEWVRKFTSQKERIRLSQAALETLAIIAYRQPIMRAEIDSIRGVDSSGVLRSLLEKSLIRIVGRHDSPGRPIMYGTTQEFLLHFGLESLSALPKIEELEELVAQDKLPLELPG